MRRLLPVTAWPEIDRCLWEAAKDGQYVATLSPTALPLIAEGYGRWIAVLAAQGSFDKDRRPADRVTPEAVQTYIAELRKLGNQDTTIRARLSHLGSALRIMEPQRSFVWLHPRKLLRTDDDQAKASKSADHQWKNWPPLDRQLWEAGLQVGDILEPRTYASKLRPATIHAIVVGYRRWLVFLCAQDRLDPAVTPAARVTRQNVAAYFKCLRESHCNASIIARLTELRRAMQIMHPEVDFRWLTAPGGRSLATLLPVSTKPIQTIDSKVLYEWGLTMAQTALADAHPEQRRIMYRNGLLIALFAARAPRVMSMASLRLGKTVIRTGETYRLVFEHEDIKTGRRLEYETPPRLSAALDRYIAVERAELAGEQDHDWFWLNQYGEKLTAGEIGDMIQRQSKRAFGKGFGPHRFRHALGTTAPLKDPTHPGVAAAILGISGHMVERHYNRATQADVANKFHQNLEKTRATRRSTARQEFGDLDGRSRGPDTAAVGSESQAAEDRT
jgi:site-specific recombinase XerD